MNNRGGITLSYTLVVVLQVSIIMLVIGMIGRMDVVNHSNVLLQRLVYQLEITECNQREGWIK